MDIKSYYEEFVFIDSVFKKNNYNVIKPNISESSDLYYFNDPNNTIESYHLNYIDKNLNKNKYPFWECGKNKIITYEQFSNNNSSRKIILLFFKKFYDILSKYDIKIFPIAGTLLCCIRENLITWQNKADDIDIAIRIEDVEKFVKFCIPELKKKFCFLVSIYKFKPFIKLWEFEMNISPTIDLYIITNKNYTNSFTKYVDNFKIYIPRNYDKILKNLYGQYKIPSNKHSNVLKLDLFIKKKDYQIKRKKKINYDFV